jgi:hypothetical protein
MVRANNVGLLKAPRLKQCTVRTRRKPERCASQRSNNGGNLTGVRSASPAMMSVTPVTAATRFDGNNYVQISSHKELKWSIRMSDFNPVTPPNPDALDAKSYLDAIVSAGQRSRALILFILILTVLTFAAIRNSYNPDWTEQRYKTLEDFLRCHYNTSDCDELDNRLRHAGMLAAKQQKDQVYDHIKRDVLKINPDDPSKRPGDVVKPESSGNEGGELSRRHELQFTIDALHKKDVDNDTLTLPVLGSAIDINDLWIVSGGIMFFLLYFLRVSLEQEYRNIKYVLDKKPQFAALVSMNQVLAPHAITAGPLGKLFELLLGLAPTLLFVYLWYGDIRTFDIGLLYVGREAYVESGIETALVALVAYTNIRCLINQAKIRGLIQKIPFWLVTEDR